MDRKLKRREFIKLSSVAVLGAIAACAPKVEAPVEQPQPPLPLLSPPRPRSARRCRTNQSS